MWCTYAFSYFILPLSCVLIFWYFRQFYSPSLLNRREFKSITVCKRWKCSVNAISFWVLSLSVCTAHILPSTLTWKFEKKTSQSPLAISGCTCVSGCSAKFSKDHFALILHQAVTGLLRFCRLLCAVMLNAITQVYVPQNEWILLCASFCCANFVP